jgi:hypothetical protein
LKFSIAFDMAPGMSFSAFAIGSGKLKQSKPSHGPETAVVLSFAGCSAFSGLAVNAQVNSTAAKITKRFI